MTAADPSDRDPEDELEDLLQFFYQCPVGLLEVDDRAVVQRVNPAAARMLGPALTAGEDLSDVHDLLARLCPDLLHVILRQPSELGPLHPGRRVVVAIGGRDVGEIEIRVVRVHHDRVMLVCSDVTEEQRLARRTLVLAGRLRDVVAATGVYRSAAAQSLGISVSGVMALEELMMRGPRTPGDLARRLGLTSTTLTATIDGLEDGGYVVRTRNTADRRSILISLAAGAERRVGPAVDLLLGGVDRVAEGAAAAHDNDLAAILDAVTSALRARAAVRPAEDGPRHDAVAPVARHDPHAATGR